MVAETIIFPEDQESVVLADWLEEKGYDSENCRVFINGDLVDADYSRVVIFEKDEIDIELFDEKDEGEDEDEEAIIEELQWTSHQINAEIIQRLVDEIEEIEKSFRLVDEIEEGVTLRRGVIIRKSVGCIKAIKLVDGKKAAGLLLALIRDFAFYKNTIVSEKEFMLAVGKIDVRTNIKDLEEILNYFFVYDGKEELNELWAFSAIFSRCQDFLSEESVLKIGMGEGFGMGDGWELRCHCFWRKEVLGFGQSSYFLPEMCFYDCQQACIKRFRVLGYVKYFFDAFSRLYIDAYREKWSYFYHGKYHPNIKFYVKDMLGTLDQKKDCGILEKIALARPMKVNFRSYDTEVRFNKEVRNAAIELLTLQKSKDVLIKLISDTSEDKYVRKYIAQKFFSNEKYKPLLKQWGLVKK